jgi:hypothetical protein
MHKHPQEGLDEGEVDTYTLVSISCVSVVSGNVVCCEEIFLVGDGIEDVWTYL